ncbi:MAG: YIP1 family protein, partial [Candidatus Krumholzibacteria bacterium]|nr:YIP1 family protein [Candidatus Krumholzibacteria bacterium]
MNNDRHPNEGAEVAASGEAAGSFFPAIIDIFIDPVKVFRRVGAGLTWWKPYIVIAVISVIHAWLSLPIQQRIMEIKMSGMSAEQLEKASANFGKFGLIGLIAAPVLLLIILVISTGIAHFIINMISSNSNFKKTLSLLTFCGFIGMLEQIINVAVVRLRGIEAIETFADQKVSFSLAAFFPGLEGFWSALMESLGIFQIWYYV